jgi:hypothetical protein
MSGNERFRQRPDLQSQQAALDMGDAVKAQDYGEILDKLHGLRQKPFGGAGRGAVRAGSRRPLKKT